MTRTFHARFANGVLVPSERVDLPVDKELTVTVDEPLPQRGREIPRYDDPNDPMPEGGLAMLEWWARHRLPIDPAAAERIAQSKAYGYYEEPDDDA
jgi:hypothetical protein